MSAALGLYSDMKKTIILGAGATYGSSTTRVDLPPPLLKDLPAIISDKFLSLNSSVDGPFFAKGFNQLLDLTNTRSDIEQYLTILHILGLISKSINQKLVFMTDDEIEALLSSQYIESVFKDDQLAGKARRILAFFHDNKNVALLNYPFNFQNLFQNSLREYMYHALTSCFCIYHNKLFNELETGDAVVNFNYDEIADYTLFSSNRLSKISFMGLPFASINLPREPSADCQPMRYLKVHGSFNWLSQVEDFSVVHYNLISEACNKNPVGNTFFPIILPTLTKEIIYKQYPIYKDHIEAFLSCISESDEIILVGKSFMNSDRELNELIQKERSSKKCMITIVDPMVSYQEFINHHEMLFNGKCYRLYESLHNYFTNMQ